MAEGPETRASLSQNRPSHNSRDRTTRVGVAGWSYPDWDGIVYPRESRIDRLTYLSRFFDTLEINSPFYRIPTPRTTAAWARRVRTNDAFRFTGAKDGDVVTDHFNFLQNVTVEKNRHSVAF